MNYYLITLMLSSFFSLLGTCLTFYVFWSLLHRLLGRLTDSGKPYAAITIVHWILLGLIVLLSIVDWGLYVTYIVSTVTNFINPTEVAWIKLESALYIIFWLLSLEIIVWSIFVVVKAGNHRFVSKVSAQYIYSLIQLIRYLDARECVDRWGHWMVRHFPHMGCDLYPLQSLRTRDSPRLSIHRRSCCSVHLLGRYFCGNHNLLLTMEQVRRGTR